LAGYAVATDFLHVGGYFSFLRIGETSHGTNAAGEEYGQTIDASVIGVGATAKFGGTLGRWISLAVAIDVGLNATITNVGGTPHGVQLFPRLVVDVLLSQNVGLTAAVGPLIVPYASGDLPAVVPGDPGGMAYSSTFWVIDLQGLLGITFGA